MTNDELRLRLDDLTDGQIREVIRSHYPSVAERVGVLQAEQPALTLALLDYVDRRGDGERRRLISILSPYRRWNGKTTDIVNDFDLSSTVASLQTQVRGVEKDVDSLKEQAKEFVANGQRLLVQMESLRAHISWLTAVIAACALIIAAVGGGVVLGLIG